ncbi:hypothetical protein QWZ06_16530 [Chryseobacterium tructae]|uniref:Peptidase C39-like domain-containing protein n=1 Tax=Chryseobacterium tructae TaxID=1037380 RepID=A0ABV7XYE8_9FLAO|nr:hypothetical protein [Chryseobacterium tructae]MDN3693783.1 hypothetical protein [Chryseobacterium tructae]
MDDLNLIISEFDEKNIVDRNITLTVDTCVCDDWQTIAPVIPANKFVGYATDCHVATHKQLDVMGYKEGFPRYQIAKAIRNKKEEFISMEYNNDEFKKGTSYIKSALKNGIPVTVGIDNHEEITPGNPDLTTDHFVVIVGMGADSKGNYFLFYDNADSSIGTSSANKLYCNCKGNKLEGNADPKSRYSTITDRRTGTSTVLVYTVTSIRTSVKKTILKKK